MSNEMKAILALQDQLLKLAKLVESLAKASLKHAQDNKRHV